MLALTNHSALWTTPGDTALRTMVGWNIEIMFMFLISGIIWYHTLEEDKKRKILGLPNPLFWAIGYALFCVFVEWILNKGGHLVWAKSLISTMSGQVAVTLLNRSEEKDAIAFSLDSLGIDATKEYAIRDLWQKKDYETSINEEVSFEVPAHGVVVLKITGTAKPFNVFQFK